VLAPQSVLVHSRAVADTVEGCYIAGPLTEQVFESAILGARLFMDDMCTYESDSPSTKELYCLTVS
jgi:hypothetical protein